MHDHTREDYPPAYRLSGLWGGEVGTILLWNGLCALFVFPLLRRGGHADGVHRRAALFLVGFSTTLALVNLLSQGLGATDPARLAAAPRGRGLADVLLTPLMVIHPPIQFLAYALMAPMGAYVMAGLVRPAGRGADPDAWASPAFAWARWAWLFATLGLGLGALWAYYVLSFGGYWAWDPVETSNLLPWLALTAFLHAGKQFLRHRDHALSAPLLAFLAFALTLFATFATRSGLWVSVHAFTDPTDRFEPDAGLRLLAILDAHAPTRLFLGLLTAALAAGVALFLLHRAPRMPRRLGLALKAHAVVLLALGGAALLDPASVWSPLFRAASLLPAFAPGLGLLGVLLLGLPLALVYVGQEERREKRALDARTLMSIAVTLFSVALGVAFLLNLQVVNRPDRLLFDQRAPFLVLPLVSALTVALALAPLGRRWALVLAGAGMALGLAAWWAFPGHRVLALSAPPLAAATLAAFLRLVHAQGRATPLARRALGVVLLLLAVVGMVLASNPPSPIPDALAVPAAMLGLLLSLALLGLGLACFAKDKPNRKWGARVRETGVYLLHLAVVLGLLGYAASTYSQDRATFTAAKPGESGEVGAYLLHLDRAQAIVDAEGRLSELRVPVHLEKDGATGEAALRFTWEGDHYKGRLDVRRHLAEDTYLTPLAFRTADGWVGADAAGSGKARASDVEAVTFTMSVLPLVGLVWTGLWMGVLGMALVLLGAAMLRGREAERAREVPVRDARAEAARAGRR